MPTLLSPVQSLADALYEKYRPVTTGALASYIPELAQVEADRLGIAIVMAGGFAYAAGDAGAPFTIQSVSKPILYGLALQDRGREAVLARIGVEPSGEAFNSINFDLKHNRPFNPMVNAGAIAATSLIHGDTPEIRFARIMDMFRAFTGHPLAIDQAVYRSEAATGHRNRAIAYLALNAGMIEGDADAHLDLYFRQCAIVVTARDLAVMGATLANGGVNPVTGERALAAEYVRDLLSVMTSCGMYDYAGEWELRVGLPAKSGVSGGIMAALPGALGIGVFSPRLDQHGNSFRGLRICEDLASQLHLHMLDHHGAPKPALRRSFSAAEVRSKRQRRAAARRLLDELGAKVSVLELQGDLFFANAEPVIRQVLLDARASHFIFDMRRVNSIDAIAAPLLQSLCEILTANGKTVFFSGLADGPKEVLQPVTAGIAADLDMALEACESDLLRRLGLEPDDADEPAALHDFDLLRGFAMPELAILQTYMARRKFNAGETLIFEGGDADVLYFLLDGALEIRTRPDGSGAYVRQGSVDPGNVVGELALLGTPRRTADVVALSRVTVYALTTTAFLELSAAHPATQSKLLIAIGRSLADLLRRANAEISGLR